MVQFLHILLNNLGSLLVRPCVTGESGENPMYLLNPHIICIHILMRDEKEGRKKQAKSNKHAIHVHSALSRV